MNNSKNKEAVQAIFQPDYNKEEIITLLRKAHYDYNLIDNKVGNILRSDNIDIESMSTIDRKLIETNNNLTEYATIRNKVIEELLKLIKN